MNKADVLLFGKNILKKGKEYFKVKEYDILSVRAYGENYICMYKSVDNQILLGYCFCSLRTGSGFADKEMYKLCDINTVNLIQFANREESEFFYSKISSIDAKKAERIKTYIKSL